MSEYKGYTKKQAIATAKYKSAHDYVKLGIDIPREQKDRYKAFAKSQGKSLARLIIELLEMEIEKSC